MSKKEVSKEVSYADMEKVYIAIESIRALFEAASAAPERLKEHLLDEVIPDAFDEVLELTGI